MEAGVAKPRASKAKVGADQSQAGKFQPFEKDGWGEGNGGEKCPARRQGRSPPSSLVRGWSARQTAASHSFLEVGAEERFAPCRGWLLFHSKVCRGGYRLPVLSPRQGLLWIPSWVNDSRNNPDNAPCSSNHMPSTCNPSRCTFEQTSPSTGTAPPTPHAARRAPLFVQHSNDAKHGWETGNSIRSSNHSVPLGSRFMSLDV